MRVAVFGHYDSRGGTTAIPIGDGGLAAARARYDEAFGIDNLADWAEEDRPGSQDFLFETELIGADDAAEGTDLDDNGEAEDGGTWVIAPPGHGDSDDGVQGNPPMLVVVPAGLLPTGWTHPRWDDDAFSFLLGTGL